MKDWIPLLQTLIEGLFLLLKTLIWPGLILIVIMMFSSQFREFFGAIIKRVGSGSLFKIGTSGIILGEDLRDSDKTSEEEKNKVATELTQKRKEDYVYEDWHNAAVIAYTEKRYEAAHNDLSQALQYAKTKEQTAKALSNQGIVLGELDRFEEAIRIFKQVNARYGKDTEPGVRERVARSLGSHGVVLKKMGRFEEAIVALRKSEVIFSELGMSENEQKARKSIEQCKKTSK